MGLQRKGQEKLLRDFKDGLEDVRRGGNRFANGLPPPTSSLISIRPLHSLDLFKSSAGPECGCSG